MAGEPMRILKVMLGILALAGLGAIGFLYTGWYPIGADVPHTRFAYWALETLRERSVAMRSRTLEVPPLEDATLLLAGGPDYGEMCAGCHLRPGKTESELRAGLYPKPPNLAASHAEHGHDGEHEGADPKADAARQFWIIKHGIKASGMPAWGATHDDQRIWAIVAFLQKLPTLTPAQYQILTARGAGEGGHADHMADAPVAHDDASPATTPQAPATSLAARTAEDAVTAFQTALKSGDAEGAAAWLAPDVLIFEGGSVERSRQEYQAHHLAADMAFLKSAEVELLARTAGEDDDVAWVNSQLRVRARSSSGREIRQRTTESALLRKTAQGWRITHLHWSSEDDPAATGAHP